MTSVALCENCNVRFPLVYTCAEASKQPSQVTVAVAVVTSETHYLVSQPLVKDAVAFDENVLLFVGSSFPPSLCCI